MKPSAQVRSIQALVDLKGALGRFVGETWEELRAADQEIRRTEEWLQGRLAHWRYEVQQRREDVRRAKEDLDDCLASGYDDEGQDCSDYEDALRQAQARLREAETELQNVQRWMKSVSETAAAYRTQEQRLSRLLAADLPKAEAFLGRKVAELEQYRAEAPAAATIPVSADAKLLAKMQQGPVDLSLPGRWGTFAHRVVIEALEEAFPGRGRGEVWVRITKPDGRVKYGRIDFLLDDNTVFDLKTHDLDRFHREGGLVHFLDEIARQVSEYCSSPDVSPNATATIGFEFPPSDEGVRLFIEQFLSGHQIGVIWAGTDRGNQ